jgi:hypothetical protein
VMRWRYFRIVNGKQRCSNPWRFAFRGRISAL